MIDLAGHGVRENLISIPSHLSNEAAFTDKEPVDEGVPLPRQGLC